MSNTNVLRGGAWHRYLGTARKADRVGLNPNYRNNGLGFRVIKQSPSTDRVIRGGSWNYFAWLCRSACRLRLQPDDRHIILGFRIVLCPPPRHPSY